MNLRIASKSFVTREIPHAKGTSLHLASPLLANILARKANQLHDCTFVRLGDTPAPQKGDSYTEVAALLAHSIMVAIGRRQDDDHRICRLLPSERPDYDVCLTFWPEDEAMYGRVYRALVDYIKPADVSAGAIQYEVL
jgi:hypothetical protein